MAKRCIAVAYSGGRDSTALLHATLAEASALGIEVFALHVHHGLSPNADAWLAFCEAQCKRWARSGRPVTFIAQRLSESPAKGDSVEAWARQARYRALRTMAHECGAGSVLLAHHQRDQAETLLLQALRGAGVTGLAGMPQSVTRDGIAWQRPWLAKSREDVEAYVRRHRLKYIDDESNGDRRFARNRLRLDVWPALTRAFPQVEASLADAATWAQQASSALDELAALDLAQVGGQEGLNIAGWVRLSPARRSNTLRSWLKARTGRAAPASLILRLERELATARAARWPVPTGELRLYRGVLTHHATASTPPATPARETLLCVRRAGTYALEGWSGQLRVQRVARDGVPLAWLAHIELRPRAGAEQFQSGIGRPPRSLKKQIQGAAVPAWQRTGPLVYSGGQLVYVPGLGLDARVLGLPGQPLVSLLWEPLASAAGG